MDSSSAVGLALLKVKNFNMSENKKIKAIIAASGTGGHLFPARLIAEELQKNHDVDILFIGAGRPLEEKLIDGAGFKRKAIKMVGIRNLGIKGLINLLKVLPQAFIETIKTFNEFKPNVVIGVGGYVSFLPILTARLKGIPSLIYELDLSPGISNRVSSFMATKVAVAFPNSKLTKLKKTVYTGHTLKKGLLEVREKISEIPRNILILGGSQGARRLDMLVKKLIPFFKEHNVKLWHQCREESIKDVQEECNKNNYDAKIVSFIDDMPKAYSFSDIIISRAGASSIMEILAVNKPAILIPLPGAGKHQRANADFLADAGKAFVVEEMEENFEDKVKKLLEKLLKKNEYKEVVTTEFKGINLDGAPKIKDEVLKLVNIK